MKSVISKTALLIAAVILAVVPAFCAYAAEDGIDMAENSATIGFGETIDIYALIADEDKQPGEYSYSTDNDEIATVSDEGVCTGVGKGEATVTVTRRITVNTDGGNVVETTSEFAVTVDDEPASVKLSAHRIALGVGKSYTIKAEVKGGASYLRQFSSSDEDVAAVDENGVITAKGIGTAEISFTTYNDKTDVCVVDVFKNPSKLTITSKNTKIQKGANIHKILYKFESGGASGSVTFTSSDKTVFKVDKNGYITGVKKGKAVVTLKTQYDNISAKQTLTVVDNALVLNYNSAQFALDRANVTRTQYGKSVKGRPLEAYIITNAKTGKYKKTLFIDFAVHGFEDSYAHDGKKLVEEANKLIKYFAFHSEELGEYRLVIIPCANPDGTISGKNNKRACASAYGRCTANHIDMNRDFGAFKAVESRKLRDFIKMCKPDVYLNMHGWLNETLGTKKLAKLINKCQGFPKYIDSYGERSDYIIAWVHKKLGIPSALVEYKAPDKISTQKDIKMIKQIIKAY